MKKQKTGRSESGFEMVDTPARRQLRRRVGAKALAGMEERARLTLRDSLTANDTLAWAWADHVEYFYFTAGGGTLQMSFHLQTSDNNGQGIWLQWITQSATVNIDFMSALANGTTSILTAYYQSAQTIYYIQGFRTLP
jgi:hypothetical protein